MSAVERMTRFALTATPDERRDFGRSLLDALDRLGVAPGASFLIAAEEEMRSRFAPPTPSANQLGGFPAGSETARKAAIDNYPRSGNQRHRVLMAIAGAGERGRTREELAADLRLPDNSVRPRVRELIEGGWVRATERTRPTGTGSQSEVLALSEKGRAEVHDREALAA